MELDLNKIVNQTIEQIASSVIGKIQEESLLSSNKIEDKDTKFLSPTEFAKQFGISRPTVYKLIREGALPYYQIAGSSKKYIKPTDINLVMMKVLIPP